MLRSEKYLRTLLQVEMMLKVWFPQVIREPMVHSTQNLRSSLPPRWHQNQLHIPVKVSPFLTKQTFIVVALLLAPIIKLSEKTRDKVPQKTFTRQ